MTVTLHVSIGPVQGFVAQARRTRDLWAGSFLLSYLAGHAMAAVRRGGDEGAGRITLPLVDGAEGVEPDPLLAWIEGRGEGNPPTIGSLPNVLRAAFDDADAAAAAGQRAVGAVAETWQRVAAAVWNKYVESAEHKGDGTGAIWRRQVGSFFEVYWAVGEAGGGNPLAARKSWRTHWRDGNGGATLPGEATVSSEAGEGGDKCVMIPELQELSGFVRSTQRQDQDHFWKAMRQRVSPLDLAEGERLSAVALVKRLYPVAAEQIEGVLGWKLAQRSWPSTSYVAAVPWIVRVAGAQPQRAARYPQAVDQVLGRGMFSESDSGIAAVKDLDDKAGVFPKLDGNCFHRGGVRRLATEYGRPEKAAELQKELEALSKLDGAEGKPLGLPPGYYAVLKMDGDSLGKLLDQSGLEPLQISEALARFTGQVPRIVTDHQGRAVFAGGDDVLALLPVEKAIDCAGVLERAYCEAWARTLRDARLGEMAVKPTISAGMVLADTTEPLRTVLAEADRLLDYVAKEGNGRSSLAVSVLKPSGRQAQWVTAWRRGDNEAADVLAGLRKQFAGGGEEEGDPDRAASRLVYRLRDELMRLADRPRWSPGDRLDPPNGSGIDPGEGEALVRLAVRALCLQSTGEEHRERGEILAEGLLHASRPARGDGLTAGDHSVMLDAALLARFLNNLPPEEA